MLQLKTNTFYTLQGSVHHDKPRGDVRAFIAVRAGTLGYPWKGWVESPDGHYLFPVSWNEDGASHEVGYNLLEEIGPADIPGYYEDETPEAYVRHYNIYRSHQGWLDVGAGYLTREKADAAADIGEVRVGCQKVMFVPGTWDD